MANLFVELGSIVLGLILERHDVLVMLLGVVCSCGLWVVAGVNECSCEEWRGCGVIRGSRVGRVACGKSGSLGGAAFLRVSAWVLRKCRVVKGKKQKHDRASRQVENGCESSGTKQASCIQSYVTRHHDRAGHVNNCRAGIDKCSSDPPCKALLVAHAN